MNGDVSHLALVCGVTTAINTVYAVQQQKKEPIVPILAGAIAFVALAVVGGLANRTELATAVAYIFLVAAIFIRGLPIIRTASTLGGAK